MNFNGKNRSITSKVRTIGLVASFIVCQRSLSLGAQVHPGVTNDHTLEVSTGVTYGGYCSIRSRLTSSISTNAMGVADITLCFLTFVCKLIYGSLLSYNALGIFFSNIYFIFLVTEISVLWWSYHHHIRVYIAYIYILIFLIFLNFMLSVVISETLRIWSTHVDRSLGFKH